MRCHRYNHLELDVSDLKPLSHVTYFEKLRQGLYRLGDFHQPDLSKAPCIPREFSPKIHQAVQRVYREAVQNPDSAKKLALYATWLTDPLGKKGEALALFLRALKLNQEEPFSHYWIGRHFLDLNMPKQARLMLERGLTLKAYNDLHEDFHGLLFYLGKKTNNERLMNRHSLGPHSYDKCPLFTS